jgi:hypothetical protein
MNLAVILLAIGFMALCMAGIGVKILLKKNGEFAGTCASNNPLLQEEGASCGVCGARPDEKCQSSESEK